MNIWNRSVGDIVAEIKMMEADSKSFYWLLEGPSDIRFFTTRTPDRIKLIASGGKRNVVGAITALINDQLNSKILGVVDADYDWLVSPEQRPQNIVTTDPRDLEGVLLRSGAFNKVVAEYACAEKIASFKSEVGVGLLEYIHDVALFFGKIRAVNDLGLRVNLKGFLPQRFVNLQLWSYDYEAVLAEAIRVGVASTLEELLSRMDDLPSVGTWHYVRGHDAVNIFTGGLMSRIGSNGNINCADVASMLRIGIEDVEYERTELYQSLSHWIVSKGLNV